MGLLGMMMPRLARLVAVFGDDIREMPKAGEVARAGWAKIVKRIQREGKQAKHWVVCEGIVTGDISLWSLAETPAQEAWLYCERTRVSTCEGDMGGCGILWEEEVFTCEKVS